MRARAYFITSDASRDIHDARAHTRNVICHGEQVLNLGGKDIQGKGWKVAPSAAASSPSKSQKKAAGMLYISPDGKKFDTPQAVFKYLGAAGGVTRAEAAAKSQAYKNDNPCPFTLKVQQGQLTVQQLGNLMVEKGPQDPTFHDESNLYPIGFEAHYADSETGTVFFNEVLDGIDEFNEDVPAFQVRADLACRACVCGLVEGGSRCDAWGGGGGLNGEVPGCQGKSCVCS